MVSAREKILVEGQHDWVKLWQVHRHVAQENLSASLAEVQRKTLELLRQLVGDGLAEIGDLRDHGARFEPWDSALDASIRRISAEYVDRFDDRAGWPWTLWLRITAQGKDLGRSLQPAYEQWLDNLREQGQEDEALPLSLEPGVMGREG
ncbi:MULTISPECIES: hypothetical protein [Mycolicibacterium]|uniref:hypothetical protein n=1 Tax=Mycolicibacterium TaxID=1866885 RepID=UPI0007EA96FE|nr:MULTISPECIES: hypothetical protein [Mycolicibacterium]MCW1819735.1 hypothetical protein [Mycolicibacterium senegalense]OBB04563.1 hypothetical protein A5718_24480 [Mycolicibacterium conceptionense]